MPTAIDLYEENLRLSKERKAQYGNIGHILRIMNLIVDLSVHQPGITEWIHPGSIVVNHSY